MKKSRQEVIYQAALPVDIASLWERQQSVLRMCYSECMSDSEVGKVLDITAAAVKDLRNRAVNILARRALGQ